MVTHLEGLAGAVFNTSYRLYNLIVLTNFVNRLGLERANKHILCDNYMSTIYWVSTKCQGLTFTTSVTFTYSLERYYRHDYSLENKAKRA